MQRMINLILLSVCFFLVGCVSQPTLDTSAEGARSFDGLYPFKSTFVDKAWARADIDLSGYKKIKLESAGIEYRPTSASANSSMAIANQGTEFPISAKNRERLRQTFADAFVEEIAKSQRFELTDETGPDVLVIRGGLLDVVSRVPSSVSVRSDIYLDSVGEATLVLELIDSESNAVLLRAIDRRAAERRGTMRKSNRATNIAEVKQLANLWARQLRRRLDAIGESMTLSDDAI